MRDSVQCAGQMRETRVFARTWKRVRPSDSASDAYNTSQHGCAWRRRGGERRSRHGTGRPWPPTTPDCCSARGPRPIALTGHACDALGAGRLRALEWKEHPMPQTVDLAYLSIAEAGALFRRRELSPVERVNALLERSGR